MKIHHHHHKYLPLKHNFTSYLSHLISMLSIYILVTQVQGATKRKRTSVCTLTSQVFIVFISILRHTYESTLHAWQKLNMHNKF